MLELDHIFRGRPDLLVWAAEDLSKLRGVRPNDEAHTQQVLILTKVAAVPLLSEHLLLRDHHNVAAAPVAPLNLAQASALKRIHGLHAEFGAILAEAVGEGVWSEEVALRQLLASAAGYC